MNEYLASDLAGTYPNPSAMVKPESAHPFLATLLTVAVFLVAISFINDVFAELSSVWMFIIKVATGLYLFYLADRHLMKGFNTIEELKRGNIAVGLATLGLFGFLAVVAATT